MLSAMYTCPGCGQEAEGIWPAPEDQDDEVGPAEQMCPCGRRALVAWPGYSFRAEAG
jgi:rRNA maturation protein Nop10